MKALLFTALGLALLTLSAGFASADEVAAPAKEAAAAPPEGPMWAPPGPEHEALGKMVGEWDAKLTCHMMPEGAQASTGTYSCKQGVGGYFLVCEFHAEMGGMPFEGRAITGYDPIKKKYVGTWVDSMSPHLYATEGTIDKAGKVYEETMTGPDPEGKPMKFRSKTTFVDDDHMKFEMHGTMPGADEQLMMEIDYTRKQ